MGYVPGNFDPSLPPPHVRFDPPNAITRFLRVAVPLAGVLFFFLFAVLVLISYAGPVD